MMSGDFSPLLLASFTRVDEAGYDGPVYDNGDVYGSVAAMRADYERHDIPVPATVWACVNGAADFSRAVVLAGGAV